MQCNKKQWKTYIEPLIGNAQFMLQSKSQKFSIPKDIKFELVQTSIKLFPELINDVVKINPFNLNEQQIVKLYCKCNNSGLFDLKIENLIQLVFLAADTPNIGYNTLKQKFTTKEMIFSILSNEISDKTNEALSFLYLMQMMEYKALLDDTEEFCLLQNAKLRLVNKALGGDPENDKISPMLIPERTEPVVKQEVQVKKKKEICQLDEKEMKQKLAFGFSGFTAPKPNKVEPGQGLNQEEQKQYKFDNIKQPLENPFKKLNNQFNKKQEPQIQLPQQMPDQNEPKEKPKIGFNLEQNIQRQQQLEIENGIKDLKDHQQPKQDQKNQFKLNGNQQLKDKAGNQINWKQFGFNGKIKEEIKNDQLVKKEIVGFGNFQQMKQNQLAIPQIQQLQKETENIEQVETNIKQKQDQEQKEESEPKIEQVEKNEIQLTEIAQNKHLSEQKIETSIAAQLNEILQQEQVEKRDLTENVKNEIPLTGLEQNTSNSVQLDQTHQAPNLENQIPSQLVQTQKVLNENKVVQNIKFNPKEMKRNQFEFKEENQIQNPLQNLKFFNPKKEFKINQEIQKPENGFGFGKRNKNAFNLQKEEKSIPLQNGNLNQKQNEFEKEKENNENEILQNKEVEIKEKENDNQIEEKVNQNENLNKKEKEENRIDLKQEKQLGINNQEKEKINENDKMRNNKYEFQSLENKQQIQNEMNEIKMSQQNQQQENTIEIQKIEEEIELQTKPPSVSENLKPTTEQDQKGTIQQKGFAFSKVVNDSDNTQRDQTKHGFAQAGLKNQQSTFAQLKTKPQQTSVSEQNNKEEAKEQDQTKFGFGVSSQTGQSRKQTNRFGFSGDQSQQHEANNQKQNQEQYKHQSQKQHQFGFGQVQQQSEQSNLAQNVPNTVQPHITKQTNEIQKNENKTQEQKKFGFGVSSTNQQQNKTDENGLPGGLTKMQQKENNLEEQMDQTGNKNVVQAQFCFDQVPKQNIQPDLAQRQEKVVQPPIAEHKKDYQPPIYSGTGFGTSNVQSVNIQQAEAEKLQSNQQADPMQSKKFAFGTQNPGAIAHHKNQAEQSTNQKGFNFGTNDDQKAQNNTTQLGAQNTAFPQKQQQSSPEANKQSFAFGKRQEDAKPLSPEKQLKEETPQKDLSKLFHKEPQNVQGFYKQPKSDDQIQQNPKAETTQNQPAQLKIEKHPSLLEEQNKSNDQTAFGFNKQQEIQDVVQEEQKSFQFNQKERTNEELKPSPASVTVQNAMEKQPQKQSESCVFSHVQAQQTSIQQQIYTQQKQKDEPRLNPQTESDQSQIEGLHELDAESLCSSKMVESNMVQIMDQKIQQVKSQVIQSFSGEKPQKQAPIAVDNNQMTVMVVGFVAIILVLLLKK